MLFKILNQSNFFFFKEKRKFNEEGKKMKNESQRKLLINLYLNLSERQKRKKMK